MARTTVPPGLRAILATFALASTALAQVSGPPTLVADLNPSEPRWLGSDPHTFRAAGSWVFFVAYEPEHGSEPWRTDGTVSGTRRIADVMPGPDDGTWAYGTAAAAFGTGVIFQGNDWNDGEPWLTDGTAAGTMRIADTIPGAFGCYPEEMVATGGLAYFLGYDDAVGYEPWRSDGTAAGTFPLGDIEPGAAGSLPSGFHQVAGVTLFSASTTAAGRELHATDGTPAGTRLVADLMPGPDDSEPEELTTLGGAAFFAATGPNGRELWTSDGTPAGTRELVDLAPASSNPRFLTVAGGVLYFIADAPAGPALWRSDGTAAGTTMIRDAPGARRRWRSGVHAMAAVGSSVAYVAGDAGTGPELWISDGTAAGTRLLADIEPGPGSSSPEHLVSDGVTAWFTARTTAAGNELWRTDGTPAGTVMVRDIEPGPGDGLRALPELTLSGGKAYFAAETTADGEEPWVSDGTPAGTFMLADIQPPATDSSPGGLRAVEGRILFSAWPDSADWGPWLTDGTAAGTTAVAGLSGHVAAVAQSGTTLLVAGVGGAGPGREAWHVDVVTGAASRVPGNGRIDGSAHALPAGALTCVADAGGSLRPGTWDGTALRVLDSDPDAPTCSWVAGGTPDLALFVGATAGTGRELFASDGTAAGTRLVADLSPGPQGSYLRLQFPFGTRMLFDAVLADGTTGLWVTDGSAAGTLRLSDVEAWWSSRGAVLPGSRLVFAGWHLATGMEPWVTDGTPAGTRLLADLVPGSGSSAPADFVTVGGRVVFGATSLAAGHELFVTDGTAPGTVLVADIVPGDVGSAPRDLVAIAPGGPVVFGAWSAAGGREPWITDGTPAGTLPLPEVVPGPASSAPAGFTPAGRSLVFAARGGPEGRELWSYPLATATEAGNCANGADDDGDMLIDCADSDCAASPACAPLADRDGDGTRDLADCAPDDPGSRAVPDEPVLRVARGPSLSWTDLAPQAGPAVGYDVAGSSLASLRTGPPAPCLASGLAATSWTDPAAPADRWYLVRAVNACAPAPPATGWGTDSLGVPRSACP